MPHVAMGSRQVIKAGKIIEPERRLWEVAAIGDVDAKPPWILKGMLL
jgi:hypothetical protein